MSSGETADEAVDAETAHGLVAETKAGVGVASHDETPPAHDLTVLVDGEYARPEWFAGAACEDAEVICVLKVLREHEVTSVEEGCKLGDGKIPYTPGVLVLVGDAGVEDEAPPRGSSLIHGPEWLNEEGQGAALRDHFHHAWPGPCGEKKTVPCETTLRRSPIGPRYDSASRY
jgi:hypothetical protein